MSRKNFPFHKRFCHSFVYKAFPLCCYFFNLIFFGLFIIRKALIYTIRHLKGNYIALVGQSRPEFTGLFMKIDSLR